MKAVSNKDARSIIHQLNRMNLDVANYEYIKEQIDKLTIGIPFSAITPAKDTRLYRGIKYKDRPLRVGQLGYPPSGIVTSFQRCNPPRKPVFYCSPDPAAVFHELGANEGDVVYLSKWSVVEEFFINQIAIDDDIDHSVKNLVAIFFETRFTQPIHDVYSSQYKITSAIAECLSYGSIDGDKRKIGAVSYPSVAHPKRSVNLAVNSEVADACLRLDYVEEIKVEKIGEDSVRYQVQDFSASFLDEVIHWAGRQKQWDIPPGATYMIKKEPDGFVVYDEHGNVVDPV